MEKNAKSESAMSARILKLESGWRLEDQSKNELMIDFVYAQSQSVR